ncbi:MAG: S-methyl-5-thioribose-1-phosphate isomerase [Firmicutes bacterium]|nr:S-methyl-5-thioribose-1-phosphate isomerase [Bacillota bacterium]
MRALRWDGDCLVILDQTKLPGQKNYLRCIDHRQVAAAICRLAVRGAPAIGVAAAYGLALGGLEYKGKDRKELLDYLSCVRQTLAATRPTAVNLFWALDQIWTQLEQAKPKSVAEIRRLLIREAKAMEQKDLETNLAIGRHGNNVVPSRAGILTHCNTGALATCGYGTALGVIRAAHQAGKDIRVFAGETRPLLQGARLTVLELMEDGIPVTLITDSMAGWVMYKGLVNMVIFGADRIARNGDTANKIGSYSLAVLAKEHDIPVYVAAPRSSFDFSLSCGQEIPIEERAPEEITQLNQSPITPAGAKVFNPAFDITPHRYLDGIITEAGILRPPYEDSIAVVAAD